MSRETLVFEKPKFAAKEDLPGISDLLAEVFKNCSAADWKKQLEWQYLQNPLGPAVYTNVKNIHGKILGHYALVRLPSFSSSDLASTSNFLSLNTAVHPEAQGQSVFTKTANLTFDFIQKEFSNCVVLGVANAQSTHGFENKLGFKMVGQVAVNVWVSKQLPLLTQEKLLLWEEESLQWRMKSPLRSSFYSHTMDSVRYLSRIYGISFDVVLSRQTKVVEVVGKIKERMENGSVIKVYGSLNLSGKNGLSLPNFLKPSPLNFIYRCFNGEIDSVVEKECSSKLFEFIDFDAF